MYTLALKCTTPINLGIPTNTSLEILFKIVILFREHDAGFLQVGVMSSKSYSLTIPPNSQQFVVSAHCPSECTSNIPEGGVNAFVYLLHSHLSGKSFGFCLIL